MKKKTELVLFVDASTTCTGWCILKVNNSQKRCKIIDSGFIKPDKEKGLTKKEKKRDWIRRAVQMVSQLRINPMWGVDAVHIEEPSVYGGGTGSAASNSGSVLKIGILVGMIAGVTQEKRIDFQLLPVREWKGTLSKKETQRRIKRAWNWCPENPDEADAVGMADWYTRKHLQYKVVTDGYVCRKRA